MSIRLAAIRFRIQRFRLEIGRIEGNEIICEHYGKEGVRLAAGLDSNGYLTEEVQQKALDTLARFREKIKDFKPEHVRAVGTQTIRIAQNNKAFLRRAQDVLGFPIEILPGQEEARLVFEGCAIACLFLIKNVWSLISVVVQQSLLQDRDFMLTVVNHSTSAASIYLYIIFRMEKLRVKL